MEATMYLAYWSLASRPFENSSDTRFYYPGDAQQGVLLKLRYAVESRQSAVVLAGAAGLGKSLLSNALLAQLPDACMPRVRIVFPQMPPDQLLALIADDLTGEVSTGTPSIRESLRRLEGKLRQNVAAGKHAVVVIDEAHLLADADSLTALRLLLNLEYDQQSPLTLLFVGQSSLITTVERMPDLHQRISARCLLQRYTIEETMGYIAHRLRTAGAQRTIFDSSALEAVHRHSLGIPRKINQLCDLALVVGYAEERSSIKVEQIDAVAEELLSPVLV
jgi:type II secretory pathway predicted ATPase ExeA